MKRILLILLTLITLHADCQDYAGFKSTIDSLSKASTCPDPAEQVKLVNEIWGQLRSGAKIPLIVNDSVAFLYRGNAASVEWIGDFNQWGSKTAYSNKGKRIGQSDIWILKASFPPDSRLDYKIAINGRDWILDPENAHHQWSGVGGGSVNSELRMPLWKEDDALTRRSTIPHGRNINDVLLNSKSLGYQVTYSVYLPAGYEKMEKLPVAYVTDGYEYTHPEMGNMITVLDNLIADKKIKPIIAVFIDHREPVNRSNNRRMEELAMNSKYLQFFTTEFIPLIESKYPVDTGASHRAIIGTSMGGLNSAYFVFSRPEVFGMAGIQSPAFYSRPQIYSLCERSDGTPIKISMTTGLINDTSEGGRKMKTILEGNSCKFTYREVNEGHSWGNWRNLIDDILVDFFGLNQ